MNIDLKNTIIIAVILYIVYSQYLRVYNKETFVEEKFTKKEMDKYPRMLKENCKITNKLHKKLINTNNARCIAKGKTDRDTINNKRLCYDDIRKEIVTGFDAESNCVMSNLINKDGSDQEFRQRKSKDSSRSVSRDLSNDSRSVKRSNLAEAKFPSRINIEKEKEKEKGGSQNMKVEEGPNYINKFVIPTYESRKGTTNFAAFDTTLLGAPTGNSHKYANISSYSDVGFSSDPAFLSRLSNYEGIKPL